MEAFNELSGRKFYTRGSHGKWYWPWGIPTAQGSLPGLVAQKILDKYFHLAVQKLQRSGSESSGMSANGAEYGLSDDHLKDAKAVNAAILQSHGGSKLGVLDAMYPDA